MAHFAQLDENSIVTQVIVVNNSDLFDEGGNESEAKGIAFCRSLFGENTHWVQTSYNGKLRKHYAGIGYTYDKALDAFIPPKPYPSWVLDADCNWQAPVPMPSDGEMYSWDEEAGNWVAVPKE